MGKEECRHIYGFETKGNTCWPALVYKSDSNSTIVFKYCPKCGTELKPEEEKKEIEEYIKHRKEADESSYCEEER
jgi:uncharacterized protein with PIN domain